MSSEQLDGLADAVVAPAEPLEAEVVDAGVDGSAEVAALRAQLAEAQRRAEFAEQGYASARKPAWTEEAKRLNPELAALIGREGFARIEATSRRGFLREVERLADLHSPSITQLKAMRESATAAVDQARVQAVEAARAEVAAAWGKPAADLVSAHVPDVRDKQADTLKRLVEQ